MIETMRESESRVEMKKSFFFFRGIAAKANKKSGERGGGS
jgi:hypothetical protein